MLASFLWGVLVPSLLISRQVVLGLRATAAETTGSPAVPPRGISSPFNVSVLTWNLAETAPTADSLRFLGELAGADFVVLGVQECENVKPRRQEGHRSRAWRAAQKKYFGKGYTALAQHRMGGLQISVFVRKALAKKVQGVQILDVACGVGNVLTNKGAVCVLVRSQGKTVAFVNGHFAAHQGKVKERNSDYHRVTESVISRAQRRWLHKKYVPRAPAKKLLPASLPQKRTAMDVLRSQPVLRQVLGGSLQVEVEGDTGGSGMKRKRRKGARRPKRSAGVKASAKEKERSSPESVLWPFDGVVFLGDLNYRLDLPRLEVEIAKERCTRESSLPSNAMDVPSEFLPELRAMLRHDQLRRQMIAGEVFEGFKEGDITFWPTFKYDRGSPDFDSSGKNRAPSWTDRILFYNFREEDSSATSEPVLELARYFSVDCRHGDHRPVCALFNLNL